jgi:hypothetical protein
LLAEEAGCMVPLDRETHADNPANLFQKSGNESEDKIHVELEE